MTETRIDRTRRQQLLAMSLKLERRLKHLRRYRQCVARERAVALYRRSSPFEWLSV